MKGYAHVKRGAPASVLTLREDLPYPIATKKRPLIVEIRAASLDPDASSLIHLFPNLIFRSSPRVPEVSFAGVVVSIHASVTSGAYRVGDPVYGVIQPVHHIVSGNGALCTHVAVSPDWISLKPATLSFEEAVALSLSGIAAFHLHQQIKHLDSPRIFVNGGTGGIGTLLIQMLVYHGATVVSTASDKSRKLVGTLGVAEIVDYRKVGDLGAYLTGQAESKGRNEGRMFDAVIDLMSDKRLYRSSPGFLREKGAFIAFGGARAKSFADVLKWGRDVLACMIRPAWLGGTPGSYRFLPIYREAQTVEGLQGLTRLVEEGRIRPIVDSTYAFEDALQAYGKMDTYVPLLLRKEHVVRKSVRLTASVSFLTGTGVEPMGES